MKSVTECMNAIRTLWTNLANVGQMFAYGLFGVIVGTITVVLTVLVDLIGSAFGFVIMIPAALFELLFKLLFGKWF